MVLIFVIKMELIYAKEYVKLTKIVINHVNYQQIMINLVYVGNVLVMNFVNIKIYQEIAEGNVA